MPRWTAAVLAKLARTVSGGTLTLTTHPDSGDRYACWPYGCISLPHSLIEDLAFPADGKHTITAKGALTPTEDGLSQQLIQDRMLPALDQPREHEAVPNGWIHQDGALRRHYLTAGGNAIAVLEHLWHAWTSHATGTHSSASPAPRSTMPRSTSMK